MEAEQAVVSGPPQPSNKNPRFTLELEFVLSLANPHYISHLAATYPHLLGISSSDNGGKGGGQAESSSSSSSSSSSARAFAAYLAYLYDYWRRPEYVQFLTHPGATLRALRLLQEESFRTAVIRPQVIDALLATGLEASGRGHSTMTAATTAAERQEEGQEEKEKAQQPPAGV